MGTRHEMAREVAGMDDATLASELAFASRFELFTDSVWLEVLTQEQQHRGTGEPV